MGGDLIEVTAPAGAVRGRWRGVGAERSAAFLGIPFAEAPVGERRFAAPLRAERWDGVRDALVFGATAQRGDPGSTLIPEPTVSGEATLNVNVFTPDPGAAGLPVLVWIHGGGFVAGSPASPWYDGRSFNRDGVVTVTISYRLGIDGFGMIPGAPANRGVRDWLAALEWVQENIAAFGGDPARVTIAGQSAGGGAVLTLLGMPAAQHLFHRVWALSGALADVMPGRAAALAAKIASRLGVTPDRAGFASVTEERLLEAQHEVSGVSLAWLRDLMASGLSIGPVVDGELLTRSTPSSLAAGVGADKPLVLGTADDEFTMAFTGEAAKVVRWAPRGVVLRLVGLTGARRGRYLADNAQIARLGKARLAGRVLTDRVFRTTLVEVADARVRAAGAASTWAYRFSWPSGTFGFAEHCLDVPFFFDCLSADGVAALAGPHPPQLIADALHGDAVGFVRGVPPGWAPWSAREDARIYDVPVTDRSASYASVAALRAESAITSAG